MPFQIETPAFAPKQRIPDQFTRQGGNVSPRVEWHDAPADTRSFALVVEDPDAPKGIFRHWAAFDIAPDVEWLGEGAGSGERGAPIRMATNDFGNAHYDGPQPPRGHGTHHYRFRLFALNVERLELPEDATADQVLEAAMENSIAEADVVGTYSRD
ncbi:MAG TPA: YbhB/YbcL family Raf kinase inhibitor-like protein [Steroidobacteraceae bacterium]|jgi:Raf kinase inhibitor-like YbhB/YbcL family protein